ncbi:MAG: GAF domain-containing protein [Anaerolineales bacterium]|nr:GAF domain-containing protein [Anaerolineales bacterium]
MFTWFTRFLFTPTPDAQENLRLAGLIKIVSLAALGATVAVAIVEAAFLPASLSVLMVAGALCLVYLTCYALAHFGRIQLASLFLATVLWLVITWLTFFRGAFNILGFSAYLIVVILASLLFSERAGWLFMGLTVLVILAALIAELTGVDFPSFLSVERSSVWLIQGAVFIATALLLYLSFRTLQNALVRARQNEVDLARRAVQVRTAAEVARDATAVRQVDALLTRAVDLVCERFGFYYAGIYILDERQEYAVLKAARGQPGREMLAREYKLRVGEVGIVGHVAGSGKPRLALDVGKDAVHFKNPWLPKTHSEMALPLQVNGQVIGVLDVQSQEEMAFDGEDLAALQTMADQLAVAFETARLFEAAQRQLSELSALQAVATASTLVPNEDDLIERATQIIGDAFYPDNFGLILVDEGSGRLSKHLSYRERVEDTDAPYPLGVGVTGRVALEGKPWRVPDVSQEPAYRPVDPLTCSELCVPLKAGERIFGVINAESVKLDAFSEADERLLVTLAGQLATAIQSARFYKETQRQLRENARLIQAERQRSAELEALRQASLRLTSSLELQPVLDVILEQAMQLVAAYDARIFLYDDERLEFGAALSAGGLQESPYVDPRPNGLTYTVARQGKQIVAPDMKSHPLFKDQTGSGAIIGLPLRIGEEILGVMNLAWQQPRSFAPSELRVLELLADQAALALANARLYSDAQERARALADAFVRLQELDRLKIEFVQTVSHELRTPLAVVLGYAELFENGDLGDISDEQRDALNIILRRLRALNKMFGDFLTILETETSGQVSAPVDLAWLVASEIESLHEELERAGLRLEMDLAAGLPPVMGVAEHLKRAIGNLLGNAAKFTPSGGLIRARLWQEQGEQFLEVGDSGIGIPLEQLERVFDRFYQVDGSTTRRYGGTGLGLALVKEVIEAHGGRIQVQSTPGQGSVFKVAIPVAEHRSMGD